MNDRIATTEEDIRLSAEALAALESASSRHLPKRKPKSHQFDRLLPGSLETMLVLDLLLKPGRQACPRQSASDLAQEGKYSQWSRFLDALSWFCDCQTAGNSVSSIAVQVSNGLPIYWLAANTGSIKKADEHLLCILSQLSNVPELEVAQRLLVEESIISDSLKFSSEKIKHYANTLCKCVVTALEERDHSFLQKGNQLLDDLNVILSLRSDHNGLCQFCVQIRSLSTVVSLCQANGPENGTNIWYKIRHYIGRMRSWHKATRTVVQFAREHPDAVTDFRVEALTDCQPIKHPGRDQMNSFEECIDRLFPKSSAISTSIVRKRLEEFGILAFAPEFRKNLSLQSRNLRCHAEIALHEHFYLKGFAFFGDEKYIGCSKPSCYCCHLYLTLHPSNVLIRPSHGNLWTKWTLPNIVLNEQGEIDRDAKCTVELMVKEMKSSIFDRISQRIKVKGQYPDSSTGLSSLAPHPLRSQDKQEDIDNF